MPSDKQCFVAVGEFDVKVAAPNAVAVPANAPVIGRHVIEKAYHGDLSGRSFGEMLSAGNPTSRVAAYVAIESFEGTLDGKTGGYALAHLGEMDKEREELRVRIVPGSGTAELSGIRGHLQIQRESARHVYTLTWWNA